MLIVPNVGTANVVMPVILILLFSFSVVCEFKHETFINEMSACESTRKVYCVSLLEKLN